MKNDIAAVTLDLINLPFKGLQKLSGKQFANSFH